MKRLKINRVYHHYLKLEEYQTNMWKSLPLRDREEFVSLSYDLMSNICEFERAMKKVVAKWIYSCESVFTANELNHQSWLGQAACAIELNSPEDATRKAWGMLTDEQRYNANRVADKVISYWLDEYKEKIWPKLDLV